MKLVFRSTCFAFLLKLNLSIVQGFSLMGAAAPWQTGNLGYNGENESKNLGEEYRFNVPRLYYAFDESFLNYYGQRGVDEVNKAFAILNSIPPVSEIDIDTYPLHSTRINHRAQSLQLFDMKSVVMKTVLNVIGLSDPTQSVFTLRSREPQQTLTNFWVIKRNFDPDTWAPSSYINGQLWTYNDIVDADPPGASYPVNEPIDPLLLAEPVVTQGRTFLRFGAGSYHTGLTRDDVGGLKYVYHPNNANVEGLPPNALTNGAVAATGQTLQLSGNPWDVPVILNDTNATTTVIPGGNTWEPPTVVTNQPAGGGDPTANPLPPSLATNGFAIRRGIDAIRFIPTEFSPLTGQFYEPFNDTYSSQIVGLNGQISSSQITRVMSRPDILFTARDLQGGGLFVTAFVTANNVTIWNPDTGTLSDDVSGGVTGLFYLSSWQNNDQVNGIEVSDGPGEAVAQGIRFIFNKSGPIFLNTYTGPGSFLGEQPFSQISFGAFDGTTNEPYVFPQGASIQEIEDQIFGGSR